jgi:hypothetical protein
LLNTLSQDSPFEAITKIANVTEISPLSQVQQNISPALPSCFIYYIPATNALEIWIAAVVHQVFNHFNFVFAGCDMQWASAILVLYIWSQ